VGCHKLIPGFVYQGICGRDRTIAAIKSEMMAVAEPFDDLGGVDMLCNEPEYWGVGTCIGAGIQDEVFIEKTDSVDGHIVSRVYT
jgi:hypothetical protein